LAASAATGSILTTYGWKGKVQNLTKARQKRLQVVAADAGPDALGDADDAL
jgi:hypothetical protein